MLPLGVHFGLAEADHHADPGLGYTDHKDILANAVQWQAKRMPGLMADLGFVEDGEEDKEESAGKRFGHMLHTLLLDGRPVFDELYAVKPDKPEGLLETIGEIRDALKADGWTGYLPAAARLHDWQCAAKLHGLGEFLPESWELYVIQYMNGREELSRRWGATLYTIDRMMDMKRPDHGDKSMRERFLSGGAAEVTVIWEDERGTRCKCRFDYLRIKSVIELKKYMAREDQEPIEAFAAAIARYAYHMQVMHYLEGWAQIGRLVRDGAVHGAITPATEKVASGIAALPPEFRPQWCWIAVQTAGLPEIDAIEPDVDGTVFAAARYMVDAAREKYRAYCERFGADALWTAHRGIVRLDDQSFRPSITERGTERWTTLIR